MGEIKYKKRKQAGNCLLPLGMETKYTGNQCPQWTAAPEEEEEGGGEKQVIV
jgi:hypothetical protein